MKIIKKWKFPTDFIYPDFGNDWYVVLLEDGNWSWGSIGDEALDYAWHNGVSADEIRSNCYCTGKCREWLLKVVNGQAEEYVIFPHSPKSESNICSCPSLQLLTSGHSPNCPEKKIVRRY